MRSRWGWGLYQLRGACVLSAASPCWPGVWLERALGFGARAAALRLCCWVWARVVTAACAGGRRAHAPQARARPAHGTSLSNARPLAIPPTPAARPAAPSGVEHAAH